MAQAELKKYTAADVPPNTHTDSELKSPEFRAGVETMKNAIRTAIVREGLRAESLDNIATVWTALHEVAKQIVEDDKGPEQSEMYWTKLQEFARWQFEQAGWELPEDDNG